MGTIIIVLTAWWNLSHKDTILDLVVSDVAIIKPKVEDHGVKLASIITRLDDMQEDIRYIRRHTP